MMTDPTTVACPDYSPKEIFIDCAHLAEVSYSQWPPQLPDHTFRLGCRNFLWKSESEEQERLRETEVGRRC